MRMVGVAAGVDVAGVDDAGVRRRVHLWPPIPCPLALLVIPFHSIALYAERSQRLAIETLKQDDRDAPSYMGGCHITGTLSTLS